MLETIDKVLLAGLGAVSMTRKRAETIFDDLVRRGQAEREGREGFVKELLDSAEKTRKEFEALVGGQVRHAVDKLSLATREDIARIEQKLDDLLKDKK